MNTEPLFRSAHDALVFAFNYSRQQYGKTPMVKISVASREGKGLSGCDGAAQAGFIRSEVSRLGRIPESVLVARFAPKTVQSDLCSCPNCNGKHPNREWTQAIETLAQHLKEDVLAGSATTWDMRIQYIERLFMPKRSANVSFQELADRNNVTARTVLNHFAAVKKFFSAQNGLEASAMKAIEERLIETGMVRGE